MIIKVIPFFAALFCLLTCCITYTADSIVADPRYELPAYNKTEHIITYKGFSDISYGTANTFVDTEKIAYTVCYDVQNKQPKWVAYDLTREELSGTVSRKGMSFSIDEKAKVPQADNYDYKGSPWTRGHIAPAADFKWSREAMSSTFYYTNCCPQSKLLNETYWEKLENRVRGWAKQFGKVYVVSGPIFGNVENGYLGNNRISIPDDFFKAILVYNGVLCQAIGFRLSNTSPDSYYNCITTIDELEAITGLDFFHMLDDSLESDVESKYDTKFWNIQAK